MKLVMRDSEPRAKRARGERMHSLADALTRMEKSFVQTQIRQALEVHSSRHSGYFSPCESLPCSQIEMRLRCYVEAAQEELDAPHKLRKARASAKIALPQVPDDAIEYVANLAIKASAPSDNSKHPLNWLESPYDTARIFNRKYPGLDFHRKHHRDAQPAIAASYYLRFCNTGDPDVLLEFLREHPIEFECSGWALSAFGRILLGRPNPKGSEKRARILFREYWKQIKHPKSLPTLPQLFILAVESEEKKGLSKQHRHHFQRAIRWLARTHSNYTLAAFKQDTHEACSCISRINFSELRHAFLRVSLLENSDTSVAAHVLQEYIGRTLGTPSRTLRLWRKVFNLD